MAAPVPTSYGLQYYTLFGAIDIIVPGQETGKDYGAFFYSKDFIGAAIELEPGADPCVIDTPNDSLIGRKPRKANFQVFAQDEVELKNFYADDDRQFFALVTEVSGASNDQGKIILAGWISPFDASESYETAPYPIEFSATDGLGQLADFPYLQYPTGLPQVGKFTIASIITNCMKWMGYDLSIWYSMHLVEQQNWLPANSAGIPQHPGPWVDAFTINKVDTNCWLTEQGDYKSCAEVIDNICETFRMRLIQHDGVWKFLCVDELPGLTFGNDTRLRYWNAYGIPIGNDPPIHDQITEDPYGYIGEEYGRFKIVRGSNVAIQTAKRRYKTTFEYGGLNSQLKNGGFLGNVGEVPDGWTRISPIAGSGVIVGDGTPESPYSVVIKGLKNGDPKKGFQTDQKYVNIIQQSLIVDLKSGAERKATFSGIYVNDKTKGAAIEVVVVLGYYDRFGNFQEMPTSSGVTGALVGNAFNLQADGSWSSKKKSSTVLYIHFDNIQQDPFGPANGKTMYIAKPTDGESFSITSSAIPYIPYPGVSGGIGNQQNKPESEFPTAAKITLSLWPGPDFDARDHTNAKTLYRNVRITLEDGTFIDLDSEVVFTEVAGLSPKVRKKTEEITLKLGDQTTAFASPAKPLRPNALLRADGITPTHKWMMAVGGYADKIQNQAARNALLLTRKSRRLFDGTLAGDISPLTVIVAEELDNIKLFALNHNWSLKNRMVKVRAVELPSDLDRLQEVVVNGRYLTKDGASYPMGAGASTLVTDSTKPNAPNPVKTDNAGRIAAQLIADARIPIDPAFVDVNVITPRLGTSGPQPIYPIFETIG